MINNGQNYSQEGEINDLLRWSLCLALYDKVLFYRSFNHEWHVDFGTRVIKTGSQYYVDKINFKDIMLFSGLEKLSFSTVPHCTQLSFITVCC